MALAIDNTSTLTTLGTTFAHTCSGSQRLLTVGVDIGGGSGAPTGVTYNSVAMTLAPNSINSSFMYYLINPPAGTFNVVISGAGNVGGFGLSFTGADQVTGIGASNFGNALSGNPSTSITTTFINSYIVDTGTIDSAEVLTVGSPQTQVLNSVGSDSFTRFGSYKPAATVTSYTMTWSATPSGGRYRTHAIEVLASLVSPNTATGSFLLTMM